MCLPAGAEPASEVEEQQQQEAADLVGLEPEPEEAEEEPDEASPQPVAPAPKAKAALAHEAPRLQRRARKRNAAVAAAIEAEEWRSDADEENSEEEAGKALSEGLCILPCTLSIPHLNTLSSTFNVTVTLSWSSATSPSVP